LEEDELEVLEELSMLSRLVPRLTNRYLEPIIAHRMTAGDQNKLGGCDGDVSWSAVRG
jgi:hypothetical protein